MSDNDLHSEEWYAHGLRFACTQCGNCCTGPPGVVMFSDKEGRELASALRMDHSDFLSTYARRVHGRWSLRELKTEHGHDCVLLDRTSQPGRALCRVYKARPTQCRTWPFWPDNLESESNWNAVKQDTPCPGMDHGPLIPIEQIRIQRDEMARSEGAL